MTIQEQEELFAFLRATPPNWSLKLCSGYVHGCVDEGKLKAPRGSLRSSKVHDDYALGYLAGFAVRRGEDAEREPWFDFIYHLVRP